MKPNKQNKKVAIIMGSQSDYSIMKNCEKILKVLKIKFKVFIVSAHRTPKRMFQFSETAEKKGFSRNSRSKKWLSDNEVLFGKAQWFMMDANIKNRGYVKTTTSCYNWVGERLNKQGDW